MKMKNKRAEQEAAKIKHKQLLKSHKQPKLKREAPTKVEKPTILIVCEGKCTEPTYFKQFKVNNVTITDARCNTLSLVKNAIELNKIHQYDEVWCVFDKDSFSDNNFNNAIQMAEQKGFHVAYSNQAFEYWFVLHFNDHQGGKMHRDSYAQEINNHLQSNGLKLKYVKNVDEAFFEILNGFDPKTNKKRVELAIERAQKIYNFHRTNTPAQAESSTTVFMLVQKLLEYTR